MTLLLLTIQGCKTTKIEKEIVLPPKPQRIEIKNPENWKDVADTLKYYEFLLQEWENWGNKVESIIKN